jgi:hypothetical protein
MRVCIYPSIDSKISVYARPPARRFIRHHSEAQVSPPRSPGGTILSKWSCICRPKKSKMEDSTICMKRWRNSSEKAPAHQTSFDVMNLRSFRLLRKSTFSVPRNKFLFLANRDIGNCYLTQQKFVEAEAFFEKILQYAPVWPGTNDSALSDQFSPNCDGANGPTTIGGGRTIAA